MPRGRFVSKCISVSEQVNKLIERCGCEGGLFFTWLIAHLDVEGRCVGNPKALKGMVAPLVDSISNEMVGKILQEAHQLGLIHLYEVDGSIYLQLPKFEEHQLGLQKNRESPSKIPPLDSSRVTPELLQSNSGSTLQKIDQGPLLNLTSLNLTSTLTSNTRSSSLDMPKPLPRLDMDEHVQSVFQHYKSYHPKMRIPRLQVMSEEYRCVVAMLEGGFSVDDCKLAIDGYHNSAFHNGSNDNNQPYQTLPLIFRNASHVQRGIEMSSSSLESSMLGREGTAKAVKLHKWVNEGKTKLLEEK